MRLLLAPLLVLSLGFAPAPFPKHPRTAPPSPDLLALQGEWSEDNGSGVIYAFADRKVTVTQGGRLCSRWIMTLHPTRTPRAMDLTGDQEFKGWSSIPYLYKLEGGTLRLMLNGTNRVFHKVRR
jgi:uncharacterized protein (TIGR03067 family)